MDFELKIKQILPKLTSDARLNEFFNAYIILFSKLKEIGMVETDFTYELGMCILEQSTKQYEDESKTRLVEQMAAIKIKLALNVVFNSIPENVEVNSSVIKDTHDTEIEDSISLQPDDFKNMEIDKDFDAKLKNI